MALPRVRHLGDEPLHGVVLHFVRFIQLFLLYKFQFYGTK
jgi:hypothetical protein